jgi:hypothetical protein
MAIVEYIGEYQPNVIHGNAKQTTIPYRSKTSHQKQIIRQGLQNGKPPPREIKKREVNASSPDGP